MTTAPDLGGAADDLSSAMVLLGTGTRTTAPISASAEITPRQPISSRAQPGIALQAAASLSAPRTRAQEAGLTLIEAWHCSPRRLGPIAADTVIVGACIATVTGSGLLGLLGATVFASTGLTFGLFIHRTCVESQGVSWYARRLIVPLGLTSVLLLVMRSSATSVDVVEGVAAGALVLIGIHALLWLWIAAARRQGIGLRPTLLVGPGPRVAQLRRRLETFPEAGLIFRAAYSPPTGEGEPADVGQPDLTKLLVQHGAEEVLIFADGFSDVLLNQLVRSSRGHADTNLVAPLNGLCGHQMPAHVGHLGIVPIRQNSQGSRLAKRAVDIVGASLLLLVTSPVIVAAAVAIRIHDPGPIIFRQKRVGLEGVSFTIYKLRSMVIDAELRRSAYLPDNINGGLLFKLNDDPRITRVGTLMRRLSIDELPQLVNVIKGDMSLVGPRPLPVAPEEFEPTARIRHSVLPGITGLWQVSGGNALAYDEMLELDLAYVVTRSLATDLKVLARTPAALIVRRAAC